MESNNSPTRKRKTRLLLLAIAGTLLFLLLPAIYYAELRPVEAQVAVAVANTATSGTVVVYTSFTDGEYPIFLEAFNAEYPDIKIIPSRASAPKVEKRILTEGNSTPVEVIWGLPAVNMMFIKWNGLLKSYPSVNLSQIRPGFRDADTPPDWIGMEARLSAFCVNTTRLEELNLPVPTSWQDLIDPMYKGHVVMSDPTKSATGYGVISTALGLYGRTEGWEYIRKLDQNMGAYSRNGKVGCEWIAEGKYLIAISRAFLGLKLQADGKPIATIFPEEPSGWAMATVGLVKKPQINPAAETFAKWAVSDSAMAEYAKVRAVTSIPTDAPPQPGYPENVEAQLLNQNSPWMAANRRRLIRKWDEEFGEEALAED
ncbi:extracellular solute-binding protein [Anaerolineales bacterium HSG24]|nr:extracellular solute-binding protein [Anaerolineales bacterium HSG24]